MDQPTDTENINKRAHKGRGAVTNDTGRFEQTTTVVVDDGWAIEAPNAVAPKTTIGRDTSRTVISRNQSPDVPFDRSINPYRGCEHGCVYCFARPTHAYLGLSPGLDFETRLFAKHDAAEQLAVELRRPNYLPDEIALGANTDPYQPIERDLQITRKVLEVLRDFGHPVVIVTKSALVVRDLDILTDMAARGLVKVAVSITSLDRDLSRRMEPRAPAPHRRLETVRALATAGVPTHVLMAPIVPAINDWEIERLLEAASEAGAGGAGYVLLRLPNEIKALMGDWLVEHYPDRAERVLSLVRQTRGGKLYRSNWGERRLGTGPVADLIAQRFKLARKRYGLTDRGPDLRLDRFKPPPAPGDQLALL
jgi:DNA repair photolyase